MKGEMPKPKFDTYMNKYVEAKQLLPKITENWEKQKTTQEKIKAAIKNKNEKMQLKSAEREIREKMKKEIKFLRADYEYRKEQENKTAFPVRTSPVPASLPDRVPASGRRDRPGRAQQSRSGRDTERAGTDLDNGSRHAIQGHAGIQDHCGRTG